MLCTNRKHARLIAPPESSAIPVSNCIGCQLDNLMEIITHMESILTGENRRTLDRLTSLEDRVDLIRERGLG